MEYTDAANPNVAIAITFVGQNGRQTVVLLDASPFVSANPSVEAHPSDGKVISSVSVRSKFYRV